MANHNRAGQPAQQSDLINVAQLTAQYYVLQPEVGNPEHAVKFGTSGHRGSDNNECKKIALKGFANNWCFDLLRSDR